jgi:hypothetical protein
MDMAKARFGRLIATIGLGVTAILFTFLVLGGSAVSVAREEYATIPSTPPLGVKAATSALRGTNPTRQQGLCGGSWVITTVDAVGDVGGHTSIALAPTYPYTPHISYYDSTRDALKHAWRSDHTWLSKTVDLPGGMWTSLALAPTHPYTPCISYHNDKHEGGQLRYACLGSTTWVTNTIGGNTNGRYGTSVALEPTFPYTPHISSHYAPANDPHLMHTWLDGTDWFSGSWKAEHVEQGVVGSWSSIALAPTYLYRPHISYYAFRPHYDLKYAWLSGTTWLSQTVDSAGDVGWYTSLALDSEGVPHISYLDNTNDTLKYAWLSGTTWHSQTLDSIGNPLYGTGATSLVFDRADNVYISYYDAIDDDLKIATF